MYDPPKGKELSAVKKVVALSVRIEEAQSQLDFHASNYLQDHRNDVHGDSISWAIDPKFALDGVRVNGQERLNCLVDFVLAAKRIRSQMTKRRKAVLRYANRLEVLLRELEKIVAPFKLCPNCKGNKGRKVRQGPFNIKQSSIWEDCEVCNGRGIPK